MLRRLGDVHIVSAIHPDIEWLDDHLFLAFSCVPKHPQKPSLSCEDLDAVVTAVSYIHLPAAVTGYAPRGVKLPQATTMFSKGAEETEVRIQDADVIISIHYTYIFLLLALNAISRGELNCRDPLPLVPTSLSKQPSAVYR